MTEPSDNAAGTSCRVVLTDRDGVIIEHVPYIKRAEDVRLRFGAATAIRELNEAGIAVVVVTNQAGIGRGYFSDDEYRAVAERMESLLAAEGATIDQTHYCPHSPESSPACECRKPGVALYRKALDSLAVSACEAVFVGDRLSDLDAADKLGGRRIMVPSAETPAADAAHARKHGYLVESLAAAVDRILRPKD